MALKPELVKKIKDYFNLNVYETQVWLALLGKGVASAGEIAETSGVPRSRTYDVLESLEKQGFAISKIGKPAKYIAVKPAIILEKLKINMIKESEEKVKILSKLRETSEYSELENIYTNGIKPVKHEDLTGAIKGKSTIYNHARELMENAKKEIVICAPARDFAEKIKTFSGIINKAKKNGVNVKIALSGANEAELKKLSIKAKEKIKSTEISAKFYIIDQEQILMMLAENPVAEDETALWINAPFFTNAINFLFQKAWNA